MRKVTVTDIDNNRFVYHKSDEDADRFVEEQLASGAWGDVEDLTIDIEEGATVDETGTEFRPIPFIITDYSFRVSPSTQKTIAIDGTNFKPGIEVAIPGFGGTVDNVDVVSPTLLEVTVTSGPAPGTYDIILSNDGMSNTEWPGNGIGLLVVAASDWLDLRAGGTAFTHGNDTGNDIRYKPGMDMFRDADGMWFTGANPWSSWVKFETQWWNRAENKTIQWIYSAPTGGIMIGIGSDATNEAATSQYNQAEMQAYLSSAAYFSSIYGNSGTPGQTGYHSNGQSLTSWDAFKIKFTNSGTVGLCVFTLYGLASTAEGHWDDETNILKTFSPAGTLNPDEEHIMPFIIPRSGGAQRFVALKVT